MADPKPVVRLPVLDLERLDRQLDRGALHLYGNQSAIEDRLHELAAYVFGGLELLIAKGVLVREEVDEMLAGVKEGLDQQHWTQERGFVFATAKENKYQVKGALVDCDARMHLCKGVCCGMEHVLQLGDVEEGVVKWDHLKPYWIRHTEEQRCVHQQAAGTCDVFEQRPLACRLYTCEGDARIWLDFERRIPNTEMIDKLLVKSDAVILMEPQGRREP